MCIFDVMYCVYFNIDVDKNSNIFNPLLRYVVCCSSLSYFVFSIYTCRAYYICLCVHINLTLVSVCDICMKCEPFLLTDLQLIICLSACLFPQDLNCHFNCKTVGFQLWLFLYFCCSFNSSSGVVETLKKVECSFKSRVFIKKDNSTRILGNLLGIILCHSYIVWHYCRRCLPVVLCFFWCKALWF